LTTTNNTQALLEARGRTHGNYEVHALITQDLKRVITHHVADLDRRLDDDMQESLDMITHKIGRIIAGDPGFADHWADIAGYAQLVARCLRATHVSHQQWHGISNISRYVAMRLDKAND
jgi:hypothetical protein